MGLRLHSLTTHFTRRSGATSLADTGISITSLKRAGHWKSTKVAEEYLENSAAQKTNRMRMLTGSQQQANATKKPKMTHPETLPTDSEPTFQQVEYPPSPFKANQPPTHKT
eukprot:7718492-Ditylum_brightwellii.AAC.1